MTNLSEAQRTQIYTELTEATSPKTAEALMHATVDAPWADVATKTDLTPLATKKDLAATNTRLDALETNFTELRSEMRVGFARVDTRFAEMDAKIEHQLRVQLVWLMATLIALGGLIIGLH